MNWQEPWNFGIKWQVSPYKWTLPGRNTMHPSERKALMTNPIRKSLSAENKEEVNCSHSGHDDGWMIPKGRMNLEGCRMNRDKANLSSH